MNEINYKKKNILKKRVTALMCIAVLVSSMTSVTGIQERNDTLSPKMSLSSISAEKNANDILSSLHYSFSFQKPLLQSIKLHDSEFTKLSLPGTIEVGSKAGAPALPTKLITLLLPPNTQVKTLAVSGNAHELETKNVNLIQKPIKPYQNPIPIGCKTTESFKYDILLYQSSSPLPAQLYNNQKVGYCRGYTLLSFTLAPVQYIPGKGTILYYPEMAVDIELESSSEDNPRYRANDMDEFWVKNLVFNPEMTTYYKHTQGVPLDYPGGICDPSEEYDFVIITTTTNGLNHWDVTPSLPYNWTSLMNKHELDDGLSCILVTIQDIDDHPDYQNANPLFDDLQAHIREFCRDAYQDWGTDYVFIGGDAEWIPARLMDYEYESNCDSDLYWSNLDNTFNDDQDSDWGEEGDTGFDLYSELFIGRITCDTPQDVSNWMKKSFYYTDATDKDYLDNAAFYGGDTTWDCQGDDFIDYSAIQGTSGWLGPDPGAHGAYPTWLGFQFGFETWNNNNPGMNYDLSVKWTAEPPNQGGWQGGSESAAISGLRTAINNNQVTLLSGIAHANEGMSLDVYDDDWESEYHNTEPFFLHDYGCHCGDMDATDDGVLHSMLFHSDTALAFGCVYHTSYGWGSFGDTNSSSALQQKLFWDYLFDTTNNSGGTQNWQLGKAMAFSKDAMAPTIDWTYDEAPGSWRGTIEACLLFADPAQKVKPPVQPEHNIGIQEFDVFSHEPADTDIMISTTLYNNGKHDESDVEVRLLVDDSVQNSTIISLFEQNTIEELTWWYHTPSVGWETLCVNVTPVLGENITYDNDRCQDVIYGPDIAVTQLQTPEFLGQGYAQDVKGYVENLGPTDETVTVEFYANTTLANSTSLVLSSGSGSWVTFSWDGMVSGIGTYDVIIHAVPVMNEYYVKNQNKSQLVTVFTAMGNILLVDDDDEASYELWYENALLASNYVYDVWERSTQPSPTSDLMKQYTAVIWFTGRDYTSTLDATDQSHLAAFLMDGGKLFISGQDIGYDIHTESFYATYLHATYNQDTAGWDVVGESGDVIGDGLSFMISSGDGANNQDWPDGIAPISPATSCFYYNDATPDKAGIRVDTGLYRVVYLAFGFEAIDTMADRVAVMTRSLSWLAAEHDLAVTNLEVDSEVLSSEPTEVKGTVMNGGRNGETDIIVDFTVDGEVEDTLVLPALAAGQTTEVFFPWIPNEGTYDVGVEVHPVPDEEILSNNALYQEVHVIPAPDNDVGVLALMTPSEIHYEGPTTVTASVRNFGDLDQIEVVVNCSLYEGFTYEEDFEADNGGYNTEGTSLWEWGQPTNGPGSGHSGGFLWATSLTGNYGNYENAKLDSVPVSLPPDLSTELSFWLWYDTEAYYDGANVKISTDGGSSWALLGSYLDPYNEDAAASGNSGIPYEPCFSGHGQGYWEQVTLDLSAYSGADIILRWHFGSDVSVYYPGFYIDDVVITDIGPVLFTPRDAAYTAEATVDVPAHSTASVEFSPPWSAVQGSYLVHIQTMLAGDENPENDLLAEGVTVLENTPPQTPMISGPLLGGTNELLSFSTSTTDPEGHKVYYKWSWGDGQFSDWKGPYATGEMHTLSHQWMQPGSYDVRVLAKDGYNLVSAWSDPHTVHIVDGYYFNLYKFPLYNAEDPPSYTIEQMTGAATAQMILNYATWNATTHPDGPPLTYDDQVSLFEQAITRNDNVSGGYIDAGGMFRTMLHELTDNGYGYFFNPSSSTTQEKAALVIAAWLDFNISHAVTIKQGHPDHMPVLVPAFGDYQRWIAVRGIHTNVSVDPYPNGPPPATIYGFWINDPYFGGIGENTYTTVSTWFADYYHKLTVEEDRFYDTYVAVTEPPEHFNTDLVNAPVLFENIGSEGFSDARRQLVTLTQTKGRTASALLKTAEEAMVLSTMKEYIDTIFCSGASLAGISMEPVTCIYVSADQPYYLVVFQSDDDQVKTIVGRMEADTGHFLDVSFTGKQTAKEYLNLLGYTGTATRAAAFLPSESISVFYPQMI
jgi:hypothetical protein